MRLTPLRWYKPVDSNDPSIVGLLRSLRCSGRKNTWFHCPIVDGATRSIFGNFSAQLATVTNIRRTAAGSCSFQHFRNLAQSWQYTLFNQLSNVSDCYANRPCACKWGLTLELLLSVAGYGGHPLPFRSITECLRGLVSLYEHPIIASVRVLTVSSTVKSGYQAPVFEGCLFSRRC